MATSRRCARPGSSESRTPGAVTCTRVRPYSRAPGVRDLAAEGLGHQLEAVAHAEDRDPRLEDRRRRCPARPARRPTTVRRDRMIAFGSLREHLGDRHRVRHDLGVDPGLPDPAGDQLGVLRPEVDDQDQVVFRHDRSLGVRHASASARRTDQHRSRAPQASVRPGRQIRARPGREGGRALTGPSHRRTRVEPTVEGADAGSAPPNDRAAGLVTPTSRFGSAVDRVRRRRRWAAAGPPGADSGTTGRVRGDRARSGGTPCPSGGPRVGLALVGPERHRPLGLRGDRQRRVDAEVGRDRRAVDDVQAGVAEDPLVGVDDAGRRPSRRSCSRR